MLKKLEAEVDQNVIKWLSPSNNEPIYYKDRAKELISTRCPGTCSWFLSEGRFKLWVLPETQENVLWVQGDPGFGKSVIAATVVEDLETIPSARVLYFFIDARHGDFEKKDPVAVLRSLVYQLQQSPDLPQSRIVYDAYISSSLERASRFDQLWEVFVSLLYLTDLTYIVIDALDECSDPEELLDNLLNLVSTPECRIKILLTSRYVSEPGICTMLEEIQSVKVSAAKTQADMGRVVDDGVSALASSRRAALSRPLAEKVKSRMKANASGMYRPSQSH